MRATRTGPRAFTVEFESEQELREEHRANLAMGGLRLPTSERPALFSPVAVALKGPFGAEVGVRGTVVALLPDGVALSVEGNAGALLSALLVHAPQPQDPAGLRASRPADAPGGGDQDHRPRGGHEPGPEAGGLEAAPGSRLSQR